jgi:hypothetical protein
MWRPGIFPGGAPHVRLSALRTLGRKRRGASPFNAVATHKKTAAKSKIVAHEVKALERFRFRPMYAQANMGHPSKTEDLGWETEQDA